MLTIQPKRFQIRLICCYDTYAPLKRVKKYKLKFKSKPWITLDLQKSIPVKNKLLTNFINKKDPILKEECHVNYKKYRNLLSTLMMKSKQAYNDRYFERNWNNIKNTWKGIKSLISLKTTAFSTPTVLSLDNGDIAHTYNNYFASIAETTKKYIYIHISIFQTILQREVIVQYFCNLLFLQPLFHEWCFSFCVFPSKVFSVFKKDSKLYYSNYHPISLLSNIEKILEKLMYKRLYTFLNNNNIIYIQFGFRQQYFTFHALINITENIRKALDDENVDLGFL